MRTTALLLLLFSGRCFASPFKVNQADQGVIQALLSEATARLERRVDLRSLGSIDFGLLPAPALPPGDLPCPVGAELGVFAQDFVGRKKILLNGLFRLVRPDSRFVPSCAIKMSPWELSISTVIHEVGHWIGASRLGSNSSAGPWRDLGSFPQSSGPSLNQKAAFMGESYRWSNPDEFFAVSFESFVQDPDVACFEPGATFLLSRLLGGTFACESLIFPISSSQWIAIKPSQLIGAFLDPAYPGALGMRVNIDGVLTDLIWRLSANGGQLTWKIEPVAAVPRLLELDMEHRSLLLAVVWEKTWKEAYRPQDRDAVLRMQKNIVAAVLEGSLEAVAQAPNGGMSFERQDLKKTPGAWRLRHGIPIVR